MLTDEGVREVIEGARATGFRIYADRVVRFGEEILRLRGYLRAIVRGDFKLREMGGGGDWVFDCGGGLVPEIRAWDEEDRRVNP